MAGGSACAPARVRIKGKSASVVRFFMISMAYLMPWVLLTSELGHYSQLYGPKVLLQLNLAFYMPSIPILLALGQLEPFLDRKLGATRSMLVRLNVGIAGCLALCAAFPFLPETSNVLMGVVIAMGVVHAVAFSTSYQLVSWFRQADTIALGIGCVGTGPLVLAIQLGLGIGPQPERWQWIAMFEVAATICLAGLLSSVSLFGQYWAIFEGEKDSLGDAEGATPLLGHSDQEDCALARTTTLTPLFLMAPDPFGGAPVIFDPDADFELFVARMHDAPPHLGRSTSMSGARPRSKLAVEAEKDAAHTASSAPFNGFRSCDQTTLGGAARWLTASLADTYGAASPSAKKAAALASRASLAGLSVRVPSASAGGAPSPVPLTDLHVTTGSRPPPSDGDATPTQSAFTATAQEGTFLDVGDAAVSPSSDRPPSASGRPGSTKRSSRGSPTGPKGPLTAGQQTMCVLQAVWPVILAFLSSVTMLYLIFPFFTYVESSGLLGARLPQWLFFTRIFADLLGRYLPRRKALLVKNPTLLLALASVKVVVAILFFVYLKALPQLHNDVVFVAIVVFLWLGGGYINTSCNILAPNLVEPQLTVRASAIMALTFQIAHFSGLLIAVLMAYLLYDDIIG